MRSQRQKPRSSRCGLCQPCLAWHTGWPGALAGLQKKRPRPWPCPYRLHVGGRTSVGPCALNTSATTYTLPLYCLAGFLSLVQLEQELEQLAKAVLALAPREARPVQHAGQGPAGAGEEGEGDIVLELCTPRVPAPPAAASSASQVG